MQVEFLHYLRGGGILAEINRPAVCWRKRPAMILSVSAVLVVLIVPVILAVLVVLLILAVLLILIILVVLTVLIVLIILVIHGLTSDAHSLPQNAANYTAQKTDGCETLFHAG